jgi:predicted flap endonuclease-1-like 5' DNA nuclease
MDSQKDLQKLIKQLESVKARSIVYLERYIKGKDEPRSSMERVEKLFEYIQDILKQSDDPFVQKVKKISDGLRVEPGIKIRGRGFASIEGIGDVFAQTLKRHGINTPSDLLGVGATRKGRVSIEEKTGISNKLILDWINRVDLWRIRGVGEEYADLLEAAGVDTVPELARRNPQNLYQKMVEVNAEKKLVRQLPGEAQVSEWVEQAKNLPRVIEY